MFDAFYIGATGMQAQQTNVDTIANNLANVNTAAYKRAHVGFSDLVARSTGHLPSIEDTERGIFGLDRTVGIGVGISAISRQFEVGELKKTDSPLDLAIQGDGFVEVTMPDGTSAYTRGGTFKINTDGLLATQAGYPLKAGITVPDNTETIKISSTGVVAITTTDQTSTIDAGQIEVVNFTNPALLTAQGDNLYRAGEAAGTPFVGKGGEDGLGTLAQGYLEGSNVKLVDEMVGLILAQRAYEASLKLVQASDEMLGMVNNLRK